MALLEIEPILSVFFVLINILETPYKRPPSSSQPKTARGTVPKAKSAEIEKFERKKTGARTGVRHVS